MSRKRSVSTDIAIDTSVNKLAREFGDFAALLYTWMIPFAEDNCEITGDPEELMSLVCPGRRDKSDDDVINAINGMIDHKLVATFTKNGKAMLLFPPASFYKYQSYINVKNRDYRPVGERGDNASTNNHQKTAENSKEEQKTPKNTVSPSPSLSLSLSLIEDEEDARAREDIPVEMPKTEQSSVELGESGKAHDEPTELPQDREGRVFGFFRENIGMITPFQAQTLTQYLDDGLDPGLIIAVMQDSLGKDDKWSWCKKVLENSFSLNIKTAEQYEAHKLERAKSRDKPPGGSKTTSKKAVQAGNFTQRQYSDDFIDGLYKV